MNNLKVGDVVWLKAGSPKMVVDYVKENSCICVWFDGTKRVEGNFRPDTLTKEDPSHIPPESFKTGQK